MGLTAADSSLRLLPSEREKTKQQKKGETKSKCGAKHTLNLLPSLGKAKRYVICLLKKKYFFPKKARKSLEGIRKSVPLQRFKKTIDCFTKKFISHTMKKLVFMFVAFAAISFASCGNKTSDAAATDSVADSTVVDSAADSAVVDSAAADSAAADTVAEPAA